LVLIGHLDRNTTITTRVWYWYGICFCWNFLLPCFQTSIKKLPKGKSSLKKIKIPPPYEKGWRERKDTVAVG
jgi:hypothetical protein